MLFLVTGFLLVCSQALYASPENIMFNKARQYDPNLSDLLWSKLGPKAQAQFAQRGSGEFIVSLQPIDWSDPDKRTVKTLRQAQALRQTMRQLAAERVNEKLASLEDNLNPGEITILKRFNYLPIIKIKLRRAAAMSRLLSHPDVTSVTLEEVYRIKLTQSLPIIDQPTAENGNILGEGVSVAIFDTGLDYTCLLYTSDAADERVRV